MINRRSALLGIFGLPSVALADFCLPPVALGESKPAKPDTRPPAIVFRSAAFCPPCDRLFDDVKSGKWDSFRWEFVTEGTADYAQHAKRYGQRIESFPTIWWPESGSKGFKADSYNPDQIRGVANWHSRPVKAVAKSATYRTRRTNWTWPGMTRDSLKRHMNTHPNHRGKYSADWINRLPFEHLKALHSDDHERAVPAKARR